jgi:hypothetical protein
MTAFHFGAPPTARPDERLIVIPARLETKAELLNLLAHAFLLPAYFGHNWDALEECLVDLSRQKDGKMLLIHHDIPLGNTPADRRIYLQILFRAAHGSKRLLIFFPESSRREIMDIVGGSPE